MKSMTRGSALLIAMLTGCGSDPATSHLDTGTEAITYAEKSDQVNVYVTGRRASGEEFPSAIDVPVGIRVVVIEDRGKGKFTTYPVRVMIKEGDYIGPGQIDRDNLRPVAR